MTGKCANPECAAPISCHEGKERYTECPFWKKTDSVNQSKSQPSVKAVKRSNLPWTGNAFSLDEISQVTIRNSPLIVGMVGKANAGKTTYLAMLFTLLLRGAKFTDFNFSGTKTIIAWDQLYHKLKIQQNKVIFPDPTPAQYIRLFHLALRDRRGNLKDILLSDASGEVFSVWSQFREDPNAENARWIYKHSQAFILFIDCVDLINRKNLAKTEIIDLAQMLIHDLRGRPVIAVWSKSDRKSEIHPKIKESLQGELENLFKNYTEIDISNFSSEDPDILVHQNNIQVLNYVLSNAFSANDHDLVIDNLEVPGDIFLNYRGSK